MRLENLRGAASKCPLSGILSGEAKTPGQDPEKGNPMKSMTFPAFAILALFHTQGSAHHSGSAFDRQAQTSIEGTIVRYEWSNPHVYLWVEGETGDGERATWEVEGLPPAALRRLGWTGDEVSVGDRVTVSGFPGRDPEKAILMMNSLEKADDTRISTSLRDLAAALSPSISVIAQQATGLAGTWIAVSSPQAASQFRPRMAATEGGLAAINSFVEAVDSPYLSCVPYNGPIFMMAPDVKLIEVHDDVVLIRGEESERTVYLNLDTHDGAVESIQGHSIGHWEGDALVIDTTHFTPLRAIMPHIGLPSGRGRHLIERLEVNEDGTHLSYSFELEDPEYLTGTLTVSGVELAYRPDLTFETVPCDIDNARRFAE
jgi:hypothetical protein